MKVTVCFGNIRVVVPCGDGDLLVSELIEKSIVRYKKATGKPADYWVAVHNVKATEGGILDTDDTLIDVADDREQLIALYEEQGGPPHHHHNGGDGTSASSSVGTGSPDIFRGGDLSDTPHGIRPYVSDGGKNDVIITHNHLQTGSTLIVRRGSEPVLTSIGKSSTGDKPPPDISPNKRWSVITDLDALKIPRESDEVEPPPSDHHPPPYSTHPHIGPPPGPRPPPPPHTEPRSEGIGQEDSGAAREGEPDDAGTTPGGELSSFARDSTRRSLANNAAMWKWLEAQETQQQRVEDSARKEPLGGTGDTDENDSSLSQLSPTSPGALLVLPNSGGALGIHVVPEYDNTGREQGGLVLQGIEPGGRIYQDGRLKVHDKIIEINGTSLRNMEFRNAQELFKQALTSEELRLRVVKNETPPPLPTKPPPLSLPVRTFSDSSNEQGPVSGERSVSGGLSNGVQQSPPASPSKKTPPPLPVRNPTTALTASTGPAPPGNSLNSSQGKGKIIAPTNTKRLGKRMMITLSKGSYGLGFSVTTRDNPAGGVPPIYIKNILPKGAAIEDGRLKTGDRLLEINELDMCGKTQAEVVAILRTTTVGSTVTLIVSRILTEEEEKFSVPRELPSSSVLTTPASSVHSSPTASHILPANRSHTLPLQPAEKAGDTDGLLTTQEKECMTFDISLNDSGSAGLGVSVKGKTADAVAVSSGGGPVVPHSKPYDLGIFIKAIITGGAANKDGRLMVNDQLIQVNQKNLAGKSNTAAMETLRKAMQKEGPIEGKINLVIARRKGGAAASSTSAASTPSREIRISQSDQSDIINDSNVIINSRSVDKSLHSVITDTVRESIFTDANANKRNYVDLNDNKQAGSGGEMEGLRNQSYTAATHESMREVNMDEPVYLREQSGGETTKVRPASTMGFQWQHIGDGNLSNKSAISSEDLLDSEGKIKVPDWLKWDENPDVLQDESISPTEAKDPGFSREGFGRQSMSEKRKGHIDPRMCEFYQKVKGLREKGILKDEPYCSGQLRRGGSTESLVPGSPEPQHMHDPLSLPGYPYGSPPQYINPYTQYTLFSGKLSMKEVGATLGLKKSSSLESLQTAVQEVVLEEDAKAEVGFYRPPNMNRGMVRGRGCNESFRAAVDRSYENQSTEQMETLEELPEGAVDSETGGGAGIVRAPSTGGDSEAGGSVVSGGSTRGSGGLTASSSFSHRQLSLNDDSKKPRKNSKKEKANNSGGKAGIFSGLFKFGRQRKVADERPQKSTDATAPSKEQVMANEQDRVEQQRMLQEKQRQLEFAKLREAQHRMSQQQYPTAAAAATPVTHSQSTAPLSVPVDPAADDSPRSQAERVQALRQMHQQRHRDRLGAYPLDDRDEILERHLQKFEKQVPAQDLKYLQANIQQARKQKMAEEQAAARATDPYGNHQFLPPRQRTPERPERSHSSVAVTDPDRYSHYANLEEIRQQLRRHDYLQQQMRYQQQQKMQQHAAAASGGYGSRPPRQLPPSGYQTHHYSDPRTLRSSQPHPETTSLSASQLHSRSYGPDSKWGQVSNPPPVATGPLQHGRSLTPGPGGASGGGRNGSPSPSPTRPRAQTPSAYHHPSSPFHRTQPPPPHQTGYNLPVHSSHNQLQTGHDRLIPTGQQLVQPQTHVVHPLNHNRNAAAFSTPQHHKQQPHSQYESHTSIAAASAFHPHHSQAPHPATAAPPLPAHTGPPRHYNSEYTDPRHTYTRERTQLHSTTSVGGVPPAYATHEPHYGGSLPRTRKDQNGNTRVLGSSHPHSHQSMGLMSGSAQV